jgi:hypothetical protein
MHDSLGRRIGQSKDCACQDLAVQIILARSLGQGKELKACGSCRSRSTFNFYLGLF